MLLALTGALGMTSAAQATLIDRGNGLIYDTMLNITWLQNANYANQLFTWQNAVNWADTLVYPVAGGYDNWRLASITELNVMYHYLPGALGSNKTGNQTVDGVTLTNIQDVYWSGTEVSPGDPLAWDFNFGNGFQVVVGEFLPFYAWAVRPGDVAAAVPEPAGVAWMERSLRSTIQALPG